MRTALLAKALLVIVFAMTFSLTAVADPIVCTPKVTLAPPDAESGLLGFFERLVDGSEKTQAFSGAVTDDPDPGCSLGLDTRPIAAEPQRRARRDAMN